MDPEGINGPEIILERRISSKGFLKLYLGCCAGAIAVWVATFSLPGHHGFHKFIIGVLIGVALILFALSTVRLQIQNTLYRVYTDRLEIETGVLSKNIENIALFRIRDIGLQQGLLGRLLNYGDVKIISTDASKPRCIIKGVDDPRAVYMKIRDLISESRAQQKTMIVEEETR